MKQIPNIFTLGNLFFGCLAIVSILTTGLEYGADTNGDSFIILPERIYLASVFIGIAAIMDFFDGFVARWLKVDSEMGKQLDSLSDVVSFGVAPAMIIYQFLRLSYAQQENGLNTSILLLLPAFILPCAGAYRLGRFNIDKQQSHGFKGVPIPAVGLLLASFPLIYWYAHQYWILNTIINPWFWYMVVFITSYLMISTLPMLALKFKEGSVKKLLPFIILAIVAVISAFVCSWVAVPITFIAYVILSLIFKVPTT